MTNLSPYLIGVVAGFAAGALTFGPALYWLGWYSGRSCAWVAALDLTHPKQHGGA